MEKKSWKFKLGLILIIVSIVFFLSLMIIPFLRMDKKTMISISSIVFIMAEVLFWTGGIFLGKELFNKYKSFLNPRNWFKKRNNKIKNEY
jgi:MFS-type transporter involved in bile tolerance (Atg22 family)